MKRIIALMLVIVFVFTLSACGSKNTTSDDTSASAQIEKFVKPKNYASVLIVSINPQFKLYLDKNNKVLAVEPVNEDAKSFSDNLEFKNKSVETVIGNIVEKANEKGFIKENITVNFEIAEQKDGINSSDILTKVVSAANKKAAELKIEITTQIKESDKSQTNRDNTQNNDNSKSTNSSKTEENKSTHTHKFSAATCTEPQKCSCGETKGFALGHKWQEATCKVPETCSVCKATLDDNLKHAYNEDGICSICNAKDPDFTYPSLLYMNGTWKSIYKEGNHVIELTHYFTNPPFDTPYVAGEWDYVPKEEIELGEDESLSDFESIVWDGITYYKLGGGFVMEGTFEETNDTIIVTDYYSDNKQMVLQRMSTNTLKVVAFNSEIGDTQIPIGTILTFTAN